MRLDISFAQPLLQLFHVYLVVIQVLRKLFSRPQLPFHIGSQELQRHMGPYPSEPVSCLTFQNKVGSLMGW
jgi:hypothetical protein